MCGAAPHSAKSNLKAAFYFLTLLFSEIDTSESNFNNCIQVTSSYSAGNTPQVQLTQLQDFIDFL